MRFLFLSMLMVMNAIIFSSPSVFASNEKMAAILEGKYQAVDSNCKWQRMSSIITNAEYGPALCFQPEIKPKLFAGPACFYLNSRKRKHNSYGSEGSGHSIYQHQTVWDASEVRESFRDCWNGIVFHACPKWEVLHHLKILNENEISLSTCYVDCVFRKI